MTSRNPVNARVRPPRRFGAGSRTGRPASRSRGQGLVEFSLVIPLFMVLLTAIIEFGFLFNATLASSFATRDASLIAAEAGDATGGDCLILQKVEQDVSAPADPHAISSVEIYWANQTTGAPITGAINLYNRTGSTTCSINGTNVTVPYTSSGTLGFLDSDRCNILAGCGLDSVSRNHPGVDYIGVRVTYAYTWHTPLKSLLGFTGGGWTLVRSNAMRMEPVL